MSSKGFDVERWAARLAEALAGLEIIQQGLGDELSGGTAREYNSRDSRDLSQKYLCFYQRVSERTSSFPERNYVLVRTALDELRGILSEHPVWAKQLGETGDGQIWFEFPNSASRKGLLSAIAGLMACGRQAGEDGFGVACSELALILEREGGADRDPVREELLTGYHVVLFQGLMFDEEVPIEDDTKIVPFGALGAFFDLDALERLAPGAKKRQAEDFTAAIVKPFRWKPEFSADGPPDRFGKYPTSPFFEDADILIELLALLHAAPAVRVVSLTPRVHRRACLLLGSLDEHRGFSGNRRPWMSGWRSRAGRCPSRCDRRGNRRVRGSQGQGIRVLCAGDRAACRGARETGAVCDR